MLPKNSPILFFDGHCTLCSYWVDFVLRNEKDQRIRFASLQSDFCQDFFAKHAFKHEVDSLVLWDGNHFSVKSSAALSLTPSLKQPYSWLRFLRIFPRRLRDLVYDVVAKNRHRWFENKSVCRLPTPQEHVRFLGV